MKVWVTPPEKPQEPADVILRDEGNLEWRWARRWEPFVGSRSTTETGAAIGLLTSPFKASFQEERLTGAASKHVEMVFAMGGGPCGGHGCAPFRSSSKRICCKEWGWWTASSCCRFGSPQCFWHCHMLPKPITEHSGIPKVGPLLLRTCLLWWVIFSVPPIDLAATFLGLLQSEAPWHNSSFPLSLSSVSDLHDDPEAFPIYSCSLWTLPFTCVPSGKSLVFLILSWHLFLGGLNWYAN